MLLRGFEIKSKEVSEMIELVFRACETCKIHTVQLVLHREKHDEVTECTLCKDVNQFKLADGRAWQVEC